MQTKKDQDSAVTHPKHYNDHPSGIECIEVTRHMNFNIGNAIKYLWRHGKKNPEATIEDLQKAIFYIQDEIEKLQDKKKTAHSSMLICGCEICFLDEEQVDKILCKTHQPN